MSTYTDIISQEFPSIDEDLFEYVNSVLENGAEDFNCSDDLFEAIGEVLNELDEKNEDDIKTICDRIHHVMKGDVIANGNGPVKILGAPIHLASLVSEKHKEKEEAHKSIWMAQKESPSVVDQRKLDKAEAKIKQKQDKRDGVDVQTKQLIMPMGEATASQQSSRKENKMEAAGTNQSFDIRIENFDIAFGNLTLIQNADIVLSFGRRYGFVGRNGLGKTTLLRMIAERHLRIPSHISVLHVEQEVVGDDTLALQSVLECHTKRESLLKEEREITAKLHSSSSEDSDCSARLGELYRELEAIDADKAPAKAGVILAGLGFSPRMQKMKTREFSGGWRMRLALARALFTLPDLLLLDEPTNMLDMKAIIWLENYLQTWPSTILVVSHDRSFLNTVSTDILHLHSQRIDTYKGNYEQFVKVKTDKLKNQQKEYEAQKEYRDHIQRFIDRFRYNANRASQVQSKLKHLERLPELKPVEKESEVVWKFPETATLSPPILQLDELEFYYSKDKPIFKNVCVSANMESRICIVGENGAGKTTLLKLLLGVLDPVNGIRHAHRNLRLGYFTQHHVDQLDMTGSSVDLLAARFPGLTSEAYRQQLGSFAVSGDLALRPVTSLSGGQKSRVAFAAICMANPNFFILDEPTNHLDMETIEALGKAINKFNGGIILVSHDERLIRVVCKELWVCHEGTITALDGGFDEYRKLIEAELAAEA